MAEGTKIGEGVLAAYGRQGLAEIRAAAPYADSPIAQHTDYGMLGVSTPGEVAEARRDETRNPSVLESRINQVGPPRDERGRDDREPDMDR
jgi:hypothetical protein